MTWIDWSKLLTDWLTAVGTVGAAAAAVWLGLREGFTRLRVTVEASKSPAAKIYDFQDVWDTITVRIVNRGRRTAHLSEFYWRVGSARYRALADAMVRACVPIELADGQELAIPFVFADQPQAFRDLMMSSNRLTARWRRAGIVVRTSIGKAFFGGFSHHARYLLRERSFYRTQPATKAQGGGT